MQRQPALRSLLPSIRSVSYTPLVLEVKDTPKGPRVSVSRTHPDLVKRLFESEVAEVRDGTVEIKAIAREAGSRTKIAVKSNDANVDPVGACVGLNGARVNAIVSELRGEKIDIINWDDNPAYLIENALSPAKVICVVADEEEREAQVIVPDYQLSLAIGKEGQNARLAARLTGFKIDIKSETQAREMGLFEQMGLQYGDTPAPSFEEDSFEEDSYAETENYPEYEEGYQEDGNGQDVYKRQVTIKYILNQVIVFCVPLIIIGFIAPSITRLGTNASKMLGVAVTLAYVSSIGAALFAMMAGYFLIPHLSIISEVEELRKLPDIVFQLDIPQIMPVMSALVFSRLLGLAATWTKAEVITDVLEEFQQIVISIVKMCIRDRFYSCMYWFGSGDGKYLAVSQPGCKLWRRVSGSISYL